MGREGQHTFGFQLSPVVWCSMMYFLKSSNNATNERAHSTCLGLLRSGEPSGR